MKRSVALVLAAASLVAAIGLVRLTIKSEHERAMSNAATHRHGDALTTSARVSDATGQFRRIHARMPASIDDLRSTGLFDTTDMVCRMGAAREPAFASPEWIRDGCMYLKFPSPLSPMSKASDHVLMVVMGCDAFPKQLMMCTVGETTAQYDLFTEGSLAALGTAWETLAPGLRPW